MLPETAIFQILKNTAPLTALNAQRLFAGEVPQTTELSTGVCYRPSPDRNRELIRTLEGGCTLVAEYFLIFTMVRGAQGATFPFTLANQIDRAVNTALDEFADTVTDPTTSPAESLEVQEIISTENSHLYGYDDKTKTHQFISEFKVTFTDSTRESLQHP